jgi:signal transduction histidine kinase
MAILHRQPNENPMPFPVTQEPVLILTPAGRDAEGAAAILSRVGIVSRVFATSHELATALNPDAGALLIAEEALTPDTLRLLSKQLKRQPPWSDIPVLLLTRSVPATQQNRQLSLLQLADALGNVMFLERPLHTLTLVSAVRTALKARQKQYEIRNYIMEKEQVTRALETAKESAETANLRKSQFLATMSHELRTPLNAVIGYGEMLQNGMGGNLSEKQSRYANNVVASGKHLLDMVNEILDVAKIESGSVNIYRVKISLKAMMDEELAALAPMARKHGVTMTCTIEPGLRLVIADPQRLKQILLNLISNALKFNRPGGRVDIRWSTHEADQVMCEIADTGIGIPEDKISDLFTEFYQVDNSSSRQHEGTGLGLAVTKRLIELHGGKITVESEVGIGSTFVFTLGGGQTSLIQS